MEANPARLDALIGLALAMPLVVLNNLVVLMRLRSRARRRAASIPNETQPHEPAH